MNTTEHQAACPLCRTLGFMCEEGEAIKAQASALVDNASARIRRDAAIMAGKRVVEPDPPYVFLGAVLRKDETL